MKKSNLYIICTMITICTYAQSPFRILGNLQVHDKGQLGFHTDLISDGDFDQNRGEVGFYNNDRTLTISGNRKPVFYDMITDVSQDLELYVSVGINNFKEFSNGRIITPRNNLNISLDFLDDAPYMGENNDRHVDGYVSNNGLLNFTFPIGDDFRLRPMRIDALALQNWVLGAYFFENPNLPSTFNSAFNTSDFEPSLSIVSPFEFWNLKGNVKTRVTLTWDLQSNIPFLANNLADLRVVGWSISDQKWVDLGNTGMTGDENSGEIISDTILPNDYEILTIGSVLKGGDEIFVYNGFSPNGDGVNDTLIIRGIESNPNNELTIYNRWGVAVFYKKNYDNSWGGVSEGRLTLDSNKLLPVGTYYYVLNLEGGKNKSGYIYIQR